MRKRDKRTTGRLMDITELSEYLAVGRNTALRFGNEARATVRIGRRVLYDRQSIDKAIERIRG